MKAPSFQPSEALVAAMRGVRLAAANEMLTAAAANWASLRRPPAVLALALRTRGPQLQGAAPLRRLEAKQQRDALLLLTPIEAMWSGQAWPPEELGQAMMAFADQLAPAPSKS